MRIAWTLFALSILSAQEPAASIRIQVTAEAKPVPGAKIEAAGKTYTTATDGSVTIPSAIGNIAIGVRKEGYLPAATAIAIDTSREYTVHVELQPAEPVEEQITVYATRNDARIQDLPIRVEVLGREEIEEKMLMTPGDIVMMLNEMGGMRVQTTSPSLGAASVRVQGMRGRYTRFLSDGLPLFGQQGAGLGLLQIPPMDLGQVEVIKGTASALYGAGAMAGVINLIARRPADEPVRELLFNQSTLGATDATAFLASKLSPQWSASLLAGGHRQQRQDLDDDYWADVAHYARGLVRPRFYWDSAKGTTALLTGAALIEDRNGGTLPDRTLAATGQPYIEALGTNRYDLGGNLQSTLAQRYVWNARFSASQQRHAHQYGENLENDRHQLLFVETSLRGSVGRHTWLAGGAIERDSYRPRQLPQFAYTYRTPGLFAQDDITVAPWLSISASARVDFQSEYGTFFSPRLSALARSQGWTARFSAGQGFFAPAPLTEETEAAGLTRLVIPKPLKAERGRSASVDLSRSIGPLAFTTTLFTTSLRHPVHTDRNGTYQLINLPDPSANRGVEFLATWRKSPFSATASYTYVHAYETDPDGQHADVPLTPRHSLGLVAVYESEDKGRIGVECYYTGRQRLEQNPYREVSRPYIFVGVLGERKIGKHLRLFLNLENLTNVRQTRWDPLLRPSRAPDGRWTVDAWAPLDGRVINGGIRLIL